MTKINELSRANVRLLHEEANKALEVVAKKYGVTLVSKNISYGELEVSYKAGFKLTSAKAVEKETNKSMMYAEMFGLPKDVIGRKFKFQRGEYEVVEIVPNRPKYPVSAIRVPDGKRFKFAASDVKFFLQTK